MTRDQSDDPRPDRPTRQRLARRVEAIGLAVATARLQFRALAPYFESDGSSFDQLYHDLDCVAGLLVDFSAGVRVGDVPLAAGYVDVASTSAQPLLDLAERRAHPVDEVAVSAAKLVRAPEAETKPQNAEVDEMTPAGGKVVQLPNGFRELPVVEPTAAASPAPKPRPRPTAPPRPVGPPRPAAEANGHAGGPEHQSVEDLGLPRLRGVPDDQLRFEQKIDPMKAEPKLTLYSFHVIDGANKPPRLLDKVYATDAAAATVELLRLKPAYAGRVFTLAPHGADPTKPVAWRSPEDVLHTVNARMIDLPPATADEFARAKLLDCGLDVPDLVVDSLHAAGLKTVDQVLAHAIDNGNALASIAGITDQRAKLFVEALWSHFDAWASLQAPRAPAAKKARKRKEAPV